MPSLTATIAAARPEHDELGDLARDRRRQLEIQIDELRAGLHLGAAEVRAALLASAESNTLHQEIGDGGDSAEG